MEILSACWLPWCACTQFQQEKHRTRSWQKTSILANYGKLIFVFPGKQNSSVSFTEALKSKWVSSNSITLVGQNTIYLKITTRFTFNNNFQRKWCKVHLLNDMLFAGLNFEVCRLFRTLPISLLPPLPIYIHTHIYIYVSSNTHWKSTFIVQIQSSFKISLYF